jgi:hypothetical protein
MKSTLLIRSLLLPALILGLGLGLGACRDSRSYWDEPELPAPSGVFSVTGDGWVELYWNPIQDVDLETYTIYRSLNAGGPYAVIGFSVDEYYRDGQVSNGITYYYAVAARDWNGRESDLSYETVHDTPRPAGRITVYDEDDFAGVDFSGFYQHMVIHWLDPYADMYLFWDGDRYAMQSTDVEVGNQVYGTDLQSAGWVESLDELDWAPQSGWTLDEADVVRLYAGHGYLVWTWDNHFAKFRVRELGEDYVVLDWAYQVDEGNPELTVIGGDGVAAPGKAPRAAASDRISQRSSRTRPAAGDR